MPDFGFPSRPAGPKLGRMSDETASEAWLAGVMGEFGCQTGTIHRSDDGEWLDLVVAIGVPEALLPVISRIPFGKGIAGAAAATREPVEGKCLFDLKKPVELCNLQQDLGGVAKEGARQTKVSGSLAVPVFSTDGARVLGTLGIGKVEPYEFSKAEKQALAGHAGDLARHWQSGH